jgi:hypothetical protein
MDPREYEASALPSTSRFRFFSIFSGSNSFYFLSTIYASVTMARAWVP